MTDTDKNKQIILQDGKIAEHWSVSDAAGLIQQLQT